MTSKTNSFLKSYLEKENPIIEQFDVPASDGGNPVTVIFREELPAAIPVIVMQLQELIVSENAANGNSDDAGSGDVLQEYARELSRLVTLKRDLLFGRDTHHALLYRCGFTREDFARLEGYALTKLYHIYLDKEEDGSEGDSECANPLAVSASPVTGG